MKRHVQTPGIRQWAGEDLIELQSEPLKALDGFFSQYGPCIIQGCQVTYNSNNTYAIAPGLVALSGTDADGKDTFKVVPFSGVSEVPLPVYLTLAYSVVERAYQDGKVKPIAYNYRAEVTTVEPENSSFLELSEDNIIRFVDVIQCDPTHRFFSDAERQKLNGIAAGANNYMHPASHPASMIAEATNKRFMTDAERSTISSLGTSYAKADFSNITSKSMGQNGYYKLPDGLLIQWGYASNSSNGNMTVYFPLSFYDTNYSITTTMETVSSEPSVYTATPYSKYSSSFSVRRRYAAGTDFSNGDTARSFWWFAIGRWK